MEKAYNEINPNNKYGLTSVFEDMFQVFNIKIDY